MKTTNISCRGDQAFKDKLRDLARLLDREQGDIVREAIDKVWGDDLARIQPPSFFAPERTGAFNLNTRGGSSHHADDTAFDEESRKEGVIRDETGTG